MNQRFTLHYTTLDEEGNERHFANTVTIADVPGAVADIMADWAAAKHPLVTAIESIQEAHPTTPIGITIHTGS